jgi:hypothetical protein
MPNEITAEVEIGEIEAEGFLTFRCGSAPGLP